MVAATVATLYAFRSPSGNITCAALPTAIICTIRRASYATSLQRRCLGPDRTGVDWHGFELPRSRRGQVSCSGGVLFAGDVRFSTLAYGRRWRHGAFACDSARAGVTCRNPAGHGVFVSRRSWRVW